MGGGGDWLARRKGHLSPRGSFLPDPNYLTISGVVVVVYWDEEVSVFDEFYYSRPRLVFCRCHPISYAKTERPRLSPDSKYNEKTPPPMTGKTHVLGVLLSTFLESHSLRFFHEVPLRHFGTVISVAPDSWIIPIHRCLRSPVDPVTRLVEKNSRVGWKIQGSGGPKVWEKGQETIERDEINTSKTIIYLLILWLISKWNLRVG